MGDLLPTDPHQFAEGDHGALLELALQLDDPCQLWHLVEDAPQLEDLLVVLGDHHPGAAVVEDVDHVAVDGARVDRGRGRAGAHDGEVGQDPLEARARHDRDRLLRADADRDQARRHRVDEVAGVVPGGLSPLLAHGIVVGHSFPARGDALPEQVGHRCGSGDDRVGGDGGRQERSSGCVRLQLDPPGVAERHATAEPASTRRLSRRSGEPDRRRTSAAEWGSRGGAGTVEPVPVKGGATTCSAWRAFWLAAAAVLAVAGVLVATAWVLVGPHDSSSATPTSVVTAPVSTAATPSARSVDRTIGPGLRPSGVTSRVGCRARSGPVLRVLQFNIRTGLGNDGSVDLDRIAAEIEAVRPDLVSLNEVDTDTTRTHADEPAYLSRGTGMHVVYGPNLIYDGGPFGNAVLSRFPVIDSRNLRLPWTDDVEPRGLLTVVVDVDGRKVAFSSTHLSSGSFAHESRLLQALVIRRALRSASLPSIVAGDLNSVPTDVPARILRHGLLDAQQEAGTGSGDTYPEAHPDGRFDYILHDRHFAAVPGSSHARPSSSDHRSVFTKLRMLPRHGC